MLLAVLVFLVSGGGAQFKSLVEEGQTALTRNDFAAAQRSLEQATRLEPGSAPAWFLLCQAYSRQGNAKAALAAAGKASQLAGKDAAILYNVGLFYLGAGHPDDSIAAGHRALALEKSYEVRNLLARAYEAKRDWPHAIAEYEEARRVSPYSEEAIFNLAQAHLKAQDFAGAIAVLDQGRKIHDKSPQLELAAGVAYYGQRQFGNAVDRFLRVMQLAPDVPQPYFFMGRVLEHAANRIPEVIERAIHFERTHPESPLGYVLHARALILQSPPAGFPPEAEEAYKLLEKALSIKQDLPEAHYLLGLLLDRKGDHAGAATEFERSIALSPRDPAPHFRLARAYERLGRKEDAARERALHSKLSDEVDAVKPASPGELK
jgi:tetratricopeptide (TPR) repeat protein